MLKKWLQKTDLSKKTPDVTQVDYKVSPSSSANVLGGITNFFSSLLQSKKEPDLKEKEENKVMKDNKLSSFLFLNKSDFL